jgi:hypothetical protein
VSLLEQQDVELPQGGRREAPSTGEAVLFMNEQDELLPVERQLDGLGLPLGRAITRRSRLPDSSAARSVRVVASVTSGTRAGKRVPNASRIVGSRYGAMVGITPSLSGPW